MHVWEHVSHSPLHSLWDLQGVPVMDVLKRTAASFNDDNLLSRSAELGYYFLFALFPTLILRFCYLRPLCAISG